MEENLKVHEEFVLDLEFINQIRLAARKKASDEALSNQMRHMYGDLFSLCSSILALDYVEKLDNK